jgi:TrkA domain protein
VEITHRTIPGVGRLHEFRTRRGQQFGVLVDGDERRTLLVHADPGVTDPDEPLQRIVLDLDEADDMAEVVHSRPVADRLAELERRLAELARKVS